MSSEQLIRNLETPRGTVDAILDTDAYNEVDDQFALAYMLLSRERIRTLGICAAPFLNRKRTSPADGMRKKHEEILQVLELMEQTPKPTVYMGVERFLVGEGEAVGSPSAEFIVREALRYMPENPLYLAVIGAITSIASAVLLSTEAVRENAVVVN